jgi:sodium transport system permease protein
MSAPDSTAGDQRLRLDWRQVRILYRREMRAAFREKTIVLNSILIPIFLYPFMLWAAMSGIMFITGQTEGFVSRIAVPEWPKAHPKLRFELERDPHFQLVPWPATNASAILAGEALSDAQRQLKRGQLDALVEFLPASNGPAALAGNFQARITYEQSREKSNEARKRVSEALEKYRAAWIKGETHRLGIDATNWQGFTLSTRNVASNKQMGTFILGLLAPIIFVVMVAIGCFYPAVDALAGERERNTWETLISTAANLPSIVTAKYLHVASLGILAGLLNLLAVLLTFKPIFAPLLAEAGKSIDFVFPWAALPVIVIAGVLLAGFVAAGMMIFAAFARTFKEGQAMVTPFYMLVLLPVVFLQVPGLKLTLPLALVPVVNLTLMIREALSGTFHWLPIGVAIAASLAIIAACIWLATFILGFEDVSLGSYGGNFWKFIQQRVLRRRKV